MSGTDVLIQVIEGLKGQVDDLKDDTRANSGNINKIQNHIVVLLEERETLRFIRTEVTTLKSLLIGDGVTLGVAGRTAQIEHLEKELKELKEKLESLSKKYMYVSGILGMLLLLSENSDKMLKIVKGFLL